MGTGYDRLAVTGAVTLGGTLVVTKLVGFNIVANQTFSIITGSSVTGTFSTVTLPTGVTGTLSYPGGNSVLLTINTALPLTLLDFSGYAEGSHTTLNWHTANETNTGSFEIERSNDGNEFVTIGKMAAKRTGANTYNTMDENPLTGNNYYRLKMVDVDGKYAYSNIVTVRFAANNHLTISPVPADNGITIALIGDALIGKHAVVMNETGIKMAEITLQPATHIDISKWPVGIYILRTDDEVYRFMKK